jgi:hypothetical protein
VIYALDDRYLKYFCLNIKGGIFFGKKKAVSFILVKKGFVLDKINTDIV